MHRDLVIMSAIFWPVFNYYYQTRPIDRRWYQAVDDSASSLVGTCAPPKDYQVHAFVAAGLCALSGLLLILSRGYYRAACRRSQFIIPNAPYDRWQAWAGKRLRERLDHPEGNLAI